MGRFLAAFIAASGVFAANQIRRSADTPSAQLIRTSDLSCAGVFLSPKVSQGTRTTVYPTTYRYEADKKRHYFIYDGSGHLREFQEPAKLSACNAPLGTITTASMEPWGGDWGAFTVNADGDSIPGLGSVFAHRLYWDQTSRQMILSWYPSYAAVLTTNSFAGKTLNDSTHALATVGCWGIPAYNTLFTGTGVTRIPASFASQHLPAGRAWAVGFGGSIGYASGNSYGPVLIAIDQPPANACAPKTDYDITSSTPMEFHGPIRYGPNCANRGLGCTPAGVPSIPAAAQQRFANYSADMYPQTWDPYDGHGWFTWNTYFSIGWYDDGVKQGVVVPMITPSGWINSTVSASPAPTSSSFAIGSIDMHDGYNLKVGDYAVVQTCTPGVEPGCATANGNHLSALKINSMSGNTITSFTNVSQDAGNGAHVPIAGGLAYVGCLYIHGSPECSRYTWRLQIYDPAQYAEVVGGTRQPYDVKYAEDVDLNATIRQFGIPMTNTGFIGGTQPIATMPDESAHQIIIAVANAKAGGGGNLYYVMNVSQKRTTPSQVR